MLLYDDKKAKSDIVKKCKKICYTVTTTLKGAENKEKRVTKSVTKVGKRNKIFVTPTLLHQNFCYAKTAETRRVQRGVTSVTDVTSKKHNIRFLYEDWKFYFEERAAIYQFEGVFLSKTAEEKAKRDCIDLWLNSYDKLYSDSLAQQEAKRFLNSCGIPF